jgi:hypothetical protein
MELCRMNLCWAWVRTPGSYILFLLACLASHGVAAQDWSTDREPIFGYSYSYPTEVFVLEEGEGEPSFRYYSSDTVRAKFMVGASANEGGGSLREFRDWMIENTGDYQEPTYKPGGRTWFVLSGYRGDQIYYQKVIFTCSGTIVNVLALVYPIDQRHFFDPIVERMEDRFTPARKC